MPDQILQACGSNISTRPLRLNGPTKGPVSISQKFGVFRFFLTKNGNFSVPTPLCAEIIMEILDVGISSIWENI